MENSKKIDDISEIKGIKVPIKFEYITSSESNYKNKYNYTIFQENEKSISLRKKHFKKSSKKMIISDNNNIVKINQLKPENNIDKKMKHFHNIKSIPNTNTNIYKTNTIIQSIISFDKNNNNNNEKKNNIRNRYNNLYTSSNITKNIKNKIDPINNMKLFPNLKTDKSQKKSLKNKCLSEAKKDENNNEMNKNENMKKNAKTPNQTFLGKIKDYLNQKKYNLNCDIKSRNKIDLCYTKYNSQNSKGYLGRREVNGIPFTFESLMIHNNLYSNKSEKKRHEIILDDFSRLRKYIEAQPENKIIFIKEFLNKYYVESEKYETKKLLALCDFICYHDEYMMSSVLKPYLNIKNMIIDLLNNINEINKKLGIKENKLDENFDNIIYEKINNNNQNLIKYSSPNINEDNMNESEINKINLVRTCNTKYIVNRKYENNLTDDGELLKNAKVKLRDLEHQKKLHAPDKDYRFRHDLIIKDMNQEMKLLKANFEKTLYNHSFPIRNKYLSRNHFKEEKKISKIKNQIIFSNFQKRPKNLKKVEEEINRKIYLSNIINKNNSAKFMLMKKEDEIIDNNKNNTNSMIKYSTDEVIKRLYYKPMKIQFGLNEVRKNNKITEYYALKLAKHAMFLKDLNENNFIINKNRKNFLDIETENLL